MKPGPIKKISSRISRNRLLFISPFLHAVNTDGACTLTGPADTTNDSSLFQFLPGSIEAFKGCVPILPICNVSLNVVGHFVGKAVGELSEYPWYCLVPAGIPKDVLSNTLKALGINSFVGGNKAEIFGHVLLTGFTVDQIVKKVFGCFLDRFGGGFVYHKVEGNPYCNTVHLCTVVQGDRQ